MNQRRLTFYSFIYRGFSAGLTFLNSVIAARYLNLADRGEYQTSVTYSTSGQFFSGGYVNYFSYALPRRPEDREQIVQMGNLVMFSLSLFVWLIAAACGWFAHLPQVVMYALVGAPLTFLFGYGSRLLNSLGEISWLNRVNIAQAVCFLGFYAVFAISTIHLDDSDKLTWTYRIWLSSWLVAVIMTLFIVYRKLGFKHVMRWRWSREEWRGLRSYGTWSSFALFSSYVNYRVGFLMIGWVTHNPAIVSVYGIAVTAAEILNTMTQSISTMVFHRVTAASESDAGAITEVASRQTLITSTMLAVVLAGLMPIIIIFYSWHKYGGAVGPFYILLPGLILKATANVTSQYFTNALGRPKTLLWVNSMVIAFNAILCLFLIPKLGMYGAGIASLLAYAFELSLYMYWYRRASKRQASALWKITTSDLAPYRNLLHRRG